MYLLCNYVVCGIHSWVLIYHILVHVHVHARIQLYAWFFVELNEVYMIIIYNLLFTKAILEILVPV